MRARRLACLRRIQISGTKGLQKPQISGTKVLHNLRVCGAEVQLSVFGLRVDCEITEITTEWH
jgi:hypothetical protein